jgi:hypothetical protein
MEPNTTSPNTAPQPQGPETTPVIPDGQEVAPEAQPAPQETVSESVESVNQNSGMVLPPVQQTPVAQPVQQPVADDTTTPTVIVPDALAVADDVDLIETEWVSKAKKIVNETRDDPREQKREVSALKADYMKKRYGKDIKLNDD